MGDNYIIKHTQVGAIGKNAKAIHTTFTGNKNTQPVQEARGETENHRPGKVRQFLNTCLKWVADLGKQLGLLVFKKLIIK